MPRPVVEATAIDDAAAPALDPPAGSDYLAAYGIADAPGPSLTWRSVGLTTVVDREVAFGGIGRIARTTTPGTGSATLGGISNNAWLAALSGVDGTTPEASTGNSTGTGTSVSVSLSPTADQLVVYSLVTNNASGQTFTAGTDNTVHGQVNGAFYGVMLGTSTGDINVTLSASREWYLAYAIVNGVSAGSDTLTVDTQPTTATSGVAMGNVVISSSDAASTATVTATIASGGGSLSGTTSAAMTAGTVTFSNLIITGSGAHTLQFSATGHDPVTSATITVSGASGALFRPYFVTG